MIGFGELRKKSAAWAMDLSKVEKIYALDWLLKGVYDHAALGNALTLRGTSALANAYFRDYPRVEDADFARAPNLDDAQMERELETAMAEAARASGLQFRPHSFQPTEARFEFTGPLGRRSAAQPLLVARFVRVPLRLEATTRALLHLFADPCDAAVRAVALEELTAESMVLFSQKPRVRDVFDLWFILTHGANALDAAQTRALAQHIADEKGVVLRSRLDETYAPLLERAWENALKDIRPHPLFAQARVEIEAYLNA